MAKAKEKKVLFEIDGFAVHSDSVYRVKHKVDYDAPSGFVRKGMSKVPETGDSFQAPFTGVNNSIPNSGRWDLGFHETSYFYRHEELAVKKLKAKNAVTNILQPYIEGSGTTYTKEDLVRGENDFFNNYRVEVVEEQVYDTNNPIDVFNFYIACLQRKLAPVGRESESTFSNAHYAVEDLTEKTTRTNVVAKSKLQASALFAEMLKTDISRARALLIYMGEAVAENTDEGILIEVFTDRVLANPSKVDTFLANHENFSSKEGEVELHIYNFLKKEVKKPSSKVSVLQGQIYYGETLVGADIKSSAKILSKEKTGDLGAVRQEILLGDENN